MISYKNMTLKCSLLLKHQVMLSIVMQVLTIAEKLFQYKNSSEFLINSGEKVTVS